MDGFNRIISVIIGLVVFIVILVVIATRLNLPKRLSDFTSSIKGGPTATPQITPTPSPSYPLSPTPTITGYRQPTGIITPILKGYQKGTYGDTTPVKKIPATGAPTLLIPFALSAAFAGMKLRRAGKRK